MRIIKQVKTETIASLLIRMAMEAETAQEWARIKARVAGLGGITQTVRDQVAEALRALRLRLEAGEKILGELDLKLIEIEQEMDFP